MQILVTGGLGYIGSHTVIELIENNHEVVIADNLINSKIEVLDKLRQLTGMELLFHQIDVTDEIKVDDLFKEHKLDGVIHFAGLKAVGESVSKPLDYYYNNLVSTMVLSKICLKFGVNKFVFSSSATVYGDQLSPLNEDMEIGNTSNPYSKTKVISEKMLTDMARANPGFSVALLRYFNPVGAHRSGLIGDNPSGVPNNLMPFMTRVAKGELEKLCVFGDDYDTSDGSGVRDYIHIEDLAKGHVYAIDKLDKGVHVYNLGTGRGTSVLELINAFAKVNNIDIPYEMVERRPGDLATYYADPSKAEKELGWKAELDIDDMVRDAWRFEQQNK